MTDTDPLLSVDDLHAHIATAAGPVRAVDGVNFDVQAGETVCLVGESGSGKTLTCDSITGLVSSSQVDVSGSVTFEGEELLSADESLLRSIRGNRIAYLFQNAQNALDPVYTVGDQLVEAITFHRDVSDEYARGRAINLLQTVGLSRPADRLDAYPHEFSDGMRQRVLIAIALAAEPDLLIADEPTSALDVTIQSRIIDLIDDIRRERELTLLLVTHDLRVVASLADRVVVMYAGNAVESGPVEAVLERPGHPYTQSLFRSFIGQGGTDGPDRRTDTVDRDDSIPSDGCRFRRECPHAVEACRVDEPPFEPVDGVDAHRAACIYHGDRKDARTVLDTAPELGVGGVDRR
ncbi:ABC transporter ATP-binding protein [Natronosalvus halobius]|uniref:ABC transporter ATP-binding protein n=1 Tax=Natronosalvus halobius TaxID=2953746 RepID=UPI00209EFC0C|nr:ABC transporter ATP-binding protein [Natronosalvus halobius]USZ72781.1 ABC transporter ATP-binding protein [Natronosalvus halobius]